MFYLLSDNLCPARWFTSRRLGHWLDVTTSINGGNIMAINKDQFNEVIDTFVLSKTCSVKEDKDTAVPKTINLKIRFQGATINTLAQSCLGQGVVVKWQNGRARKDFTKLVDRQTVEIDWASPATAPQMDPRDAMLADAKAAGVDIKNKAELMRWVENQFNIR